MVYPPSSVTTHGITGRAGSSRSAGDKPLGWKKLKQPMEVVVTDAAKGLCDMAKNVAAAKMMKWINIVNDYEKNVRQFTQLHARLISKKSDAQARVEAGERKGERRADLFDNWLDWANTLLLNVQNTTDENWHELLMEEEDRKAADKCCFNLVGWNPKFRHHISVKAKELADLIKERIDELDGCGDHLTIPMAPPSLGSAGQGDFCSRLQSRQDDVERILQALISCGKVNRIGIHGMGGAGKTTLAKEVARRAVNEKLFKEVVVVKISRTPDIKQIQDCIAERIGLSLDGFHTIKERALRLHQKFKDFLRPIKKKSGNDNQQVVPQSQRRQSKKEKIADEKLSQPEEDCKLLFILDDLWSKQDLHSIGIYNDLQTDSRCKVVVTSRKEDVCRQMGASHPHIYKVGDLTPNEAEILFRAKVGEILQQDHEYEETMKQILMKCSRLPLTISVLADMLKNHDLNFWRSKDLTEVLSETYSILELSYDNIDDEEKKRFFLLCCLFPPGSNILIVQLLSYGIGLDLFQSVNSLSEAIEQAHNWVEELKSLSLLLDIDADKEEIKIHDDVREAGHRIAGKVKEDMFAFHVGSIPRWMKNTKILQYAAISMVSDDNHMCLSTLHLPNLRLLRLQNAKSFCDDYFLGMQKIKVLDLAKSKIEMLPQSMEQLKSLRTLLLDDCELEDISYLCTLTKLHVLSMRGSNIQKLPKEVSNLVNLRLLNMTGCKKLTDIPAGVLASLIQLEGLYMKDSFNGWEVDGGCTDRANISELEHCLSLQEIEIEVRSVEQLPEGDFPINIGGGVSRFKVKLGNVEWPTKFEPCIQRYIGVESVETHNLVKEGWKAILKKSDSIVLANFDGSRWGARPQLQKLVPDIIFSALKMLYLLGITGIEYALPSVDNANTLQQLKVEKCEDLKYVVPSPKALDVIQFPRLQTVSLTSLPFLRSFCDEVSIANADMKITIHTLFSKKIRCPSLEVLYVDSVPKIQQLWDVTNNQEYTSSFPKLGEVDVLSMPLLKHVWSKQFICSGEDINFSNIRNLTIDGCQSIESVCPISVAIHGLQQLENLTIKSCETMQLVILTDIAERDSEDGSSSSACFPHLLSVDLLSLSNLECFYEGNLNMEFPSLKNLNLTDLCKLETFIRLKGGSKFAVHQDAGDDYVEYDESEHIGTKTLFITAKTSFPSLEDLKLSSIHEVELVWHTTNIQELAREFPKLQNIQLSDMSKLKHLWGTTNDQLHRGSSNCLYLNKLVVNDCPALKTVCPPSIASGLKQLEQLEVSHCTTLTQVISTEEVEDEEWNFVIDNTIHFDMLSSLKLRGLTSLTCFYRGHLKIEFSAMKEIHLDELENFMTFCKPLGDRWCLREGEDHIHDMENDDDGRLATRTSIFLLEKTILPSLKKLVVKDLCNIETIWDVGVWDGLGVELPKLECLIILHMPKLKVIWRGTNIYNVTAMLKMLQLENLPMIEAILVEVKSNIIIEEALAWNEEVDQIGSSATKAAFFNRKFEFPCLEALEMKDVPQLELLLDNTDNLNQQQMEHIATCSNLAFPKLRVLHLSNCPILVSKHFQQDMCRNLSALVVSKMPNLRCLLSMTTTMEMIERSEALFINWSQLENIEQLAIKDCENLEELFDVNDQYGALTRLRTLKISRLEKLKKVPFDMFPCLKEVSIQGCLLGGSTFLISSASTAMVRQLEKVDIVDCDYLEAIIAEGLEEKGDQFDNDEQISSGNHTCMIELPLLNEIVLGNMLSLCAFSSSCLDVHLPSLGVLNVYNCYGMRSFSTGKLLTPKQLNTVCLNDETIEVDEDVNAVLAPKLARNNKEMKKWPQMVNHRLHEHVLELSFRTGDFQCASCNYFCLLECRFACKPCKFVLCSDCALDEDQLEDIPEIMKVVMDSWPKALQHRQHMHASNTNIHPLELKMTKEPYTCEACKQEGLGWSYSCTIGAGVYCWSQHYDCGFKVHPKCVLDEKLMLLPKEELDPVQNVITTSTINATQQPLGPPPEGWPTITQHELHVELNFHPLRLITGTYYSCNICQEDWRFNLDLFSFSCPDCYFNAHPKCVLMESLLRQAELNKHQDHSETPATVSTRQQPAQGSSTTTDGISFASTPASLSPTDQVLTLTPTEAVSSSSVAAPLPSITQAPIASLFIGGNFVESESSEVVNVKNPATQEVVSLVQSITKQEFKAAVFAAKQASISWKHTPVTTRQRIMLKFRELIQRDTEKLAVKIVTEQGKTLKDAKSEVYHGLDVVDFACKMATHQMGALVSNHAYGQLDSYSIREPLGVCAGISGSSILPAIVPLWMFPIAVTCGNTFILKPSEKDSGISILLASLAKESGLPDGVLNIVYGADDLINTICKDDYIQAISFVGSYATSMEIYAKGLCEIKRIKCNMGARNYMVVLPDAEIDAAVDILVMEGFGVAGERLTQLSCLIFVGNSKNWEPKLVERAGMLSVNAGIEPDSEIGPLETIQEKERICGLIQSAIESGCRILLDGRSIVIPKYEQGSFIGPTILCDVKPHMNIYKEEISGPVLLCLQASSLEEAVNIINVDRYVNGAFIFTSSVTTARKFQTVVDSKQVGWNVLVPAPLPFISSTGKKTASASDLKSYGSSEIEFYTQLKPLN